MRAISYTIRVEICPPVSSNSLICLSRMINRMFFKLQLRSRFAHLVSQIARSKAGASSTTSRQSGKSKLWTRYYQKQRNSIIVIK